MSINWENAVARRDTFQKLEVTSKDVRPVRMHTFTFFLSDGGPALPDRHPHYTATGTTEEEAEQKAYIVYMRAVKCQHRFISNGHQLQCKLCDVRLDALQGALLSAQQGADTPPASSKASTARAAGPLSGLRKLFSGRQGS